MRNGPAYFPLQLAAAGLTLVHWAGIALAVDLAPTARNVHFELHGIALDAEAATPLVTQSLDPSGTEAAYRQVLTLLESGKASVVTWTTSVSKTGEVATMQTVKEIQFPLGDEAREDTTDLVINGRVFGGNAEYFEHEHRGISLQVAGTVFDAGKAIALQFQYRKIDLDPTDEITARMNEVSEVDGTLLPADMTVQSGQRVFLGAFRNPSRPGKVDLFFLRAEVRDVWKDTAPAKSKAP